MKGEARAMGKQNSGSNSLRVSKIALIHIYTMHLLEGLRST